ncbi:hypothetical protein [Methanosphaera sp. BMS]|uniref:hypothetical protein n=1 Tax=Methanosphaera sp. BMS TaxID=1789762 RepID=UPI0013A6C60C|nr:hypothetical protein [Methanosphaera sp. BMS]
MKKLKYVLFFAIVLLLLVGASSAEEVSTDTICTADATETAITDTVQVSQADNNNLEDIITEKSESDRTLDQGVNTHKAIQKDMMNNIKKDSTVNSWSTLASAVSSATSDTIITLDEGTYTTTSTIPFSKKITVTIDGNGQTIDGNQLQVFSIGSGSSLVLKNITIRNAKSYNGGVIYNNGTLTIFNSTLINNTANSGGAIYNDIKSTSSIYNSTLSNNTVNNDTGEAVFERDSYYWNSPYAINLAGGAIYNNDGTMSIYNSTLSNNTAQVCGGAIYNRNGTMNIYNSTLNNNNATHGGVIFNTMGHNSAESFMGYNSAEDLVSAVLNIYNCSLYDNHATEEGGAISQSMAITNIYNSSLYNNTANNGGATFNNGYFVFFNIYNSSLYDNHATEHGGAIYNYGTAISDYSYQLYNSTLYNNTADNGGAIYNMGSLNISLSSLYDNYANNGGAIYAGGTLNISFSSLYNNHATEYGGAIFANSVLYISFSSLYDNYANNGGAIYNYWSLYLSFSALYNNYANNGGAIYSYGTVDLNYSTLKNNTATSGSGGAIYNGEYYDDELLETLRAYMDIYKSTLNNNNANTSGGAIYHNSGGYLEINCSTINNNTAISESGGAIYYDKLSHLRIKESTINNNKAKQSGGAIYKVGSADIYNSEINNNQANMDGGAIYHIRYYSLSGFNQMLMIDNSTLNNNIADGNGGAIYHYMTPSSYTFYRNLSVYYSTLNNNTAINGNGGAIYVNGSSNIFNSTLNNNTAVNGNGGAIFKNKGIISIDNSTLNNNNAKIGGAITNTEGTCNITGNLFTENTADNGETLYLPGEKTVENNTYNHTDILLKTINLTVKDNQETFRLGEDAVLNFSIELENPDYYDNDILEKIEDITLYINNKINITTKYENYTLSQLNPGKYTTYFTTCNTESNPVTFKVVIGFSEINTDKIIYDYVDGIKETVTLDINDPIGEKGTVTASIKEDDNYNELLTIYNVADGYEFSTESIIQALKNMYSSLDDSYTINLTYTSNNEYIAPSSTEFTLNIIKQRNTTITYDIINNTEGNVQINITVLDKIYNTPIPDATISITGDITKKTTHGIITDDTLTIGEHTINVEYEENEDYNASSTTITFTVEIDKDKKIGELEEIINNLTEQLEEANNSIRTLNEQLTEARQNIETLKNNITQLTTQLQEAQEQINKLNNSNEKLNKEINNLTIQLNQSNNEIKTLKTTLNKLNQTLNNLTRQLEQAQQTIKTLNNTIQELTKPPLDTTITINPIKSNIGSITKITAKITDENKQKVNGGKVIFKINGITLKDENNNTLYAQVKDGTATLNYKVEKVWIKNTTYIEAVYSGNNNYSSTRTKAYNILNITKGKATIILEDNITAKAGDTITLRAKILDSNKDRINNEKIIFKLNGITLKDSQGNTVYAELKDGIATLQYTLPPNYGAKTYTLTAVLGGNYYQRTQNNTTLTVKKKAVSINTDSITTKNNKTTIKATITDENESPLITSTKLAVKANGITIVNNATSENGVINLSFTTTLRPGLYELLIISGENGIYKSTKTTAILKI